VDPNGQIINKMIAQNTSMTYLSLMLVLDTYRPVVDRTEIAGEFDFELEYAPSNSTVDFAGPRSLQRSGATGTEVGVRKSSRSGTRDRPRGETGRQLNQCVTNALYFADLTNNGAHRAPLQYLPLAP
jgi:uncharacterized protein (TIGR03435 family)